MFYVPEIDLACVTVYRPPNCPMVKFKEVILSIHKWLEKLDSDKICPKIIINGDFNFPTMKGWSGSDIDDLINHIEIREKSGKSLSEVKIQAKDLAELAQTNFLEQHIKDPTRKTNILDLFFTNDQDMIITQEFIENVITSDHTLNIMTTNIKIGVPVNKPEINPYTTVIQDYDTLDANEDDWEKVRMELNNNDWNNLLAGKTTDEIVDIIIAAIEQAVKNNIKPKLKKKVIHNKDGLQFKSKNKIPRNVRSLFKSKRRISSQIRKSSTVSHIVNLRKKIMNIEIELKNHYNNRINKIEDEIFLKAQENKEILYRYIKRKQKVQNQVGPFMENNKIIEGKAADILVKQYQSVYTTPREEFVVNYDNYFKELCVDCESEHTHICMEDVVNVGSYYFTDIFVDTDDVIKAINMITMSESAGPDGIPGVLMRKCAECLSFPISVLWNESVRTGITPVRLKDGITLPAQKPGADRTDPSSYRPLCLTSHLAKTFERILKKKLQKHLEDNGLIGDFQHGFRAERSCLSQLLQMSENMLLELEQGSNYDTIYLDFAKAFDKVDYGILASKMKRKRVSGNVARWIINFISGRTHRVWANGEVSESVVIESGVPQGTVIAPLLFLIMIDDLGNIEVDDDTDIKAFADDSKIGRKIDNLDDAVNLQNSLFKIMEWEHDNNMAFNMEKFKWLQIGNNKTLKNDYCYFTRDFEHIIIPTQSTKDLGVLVSDDTTFYNHINEIHKKVSKRINWILRSFKCRSTHFMRFIWRAYVLPIIDYSSQLWGPQEGPLLLKLENLQRSFTRRVEGLGTKTYWERLKMLKLQSIQRRIERYKLLYVCKIMKGLVPNCGLVWDYNDRRGRKCKIPNYGKYFKKARDQSFCMSASRLFNELPRILRDDQCSSIDVWKGKLDTLLSEMPDWPRTDDLLPRFTCPNSLKPTNSLVVIFKQLNVESRKFTEINYVTEDDIIDGQDIEDDFFFYCPLD